MKPDLRAVTSELPDPPYPADTKSNGWNVEFDEQRIRSSTTWVLAKPEERPWLLMVWHEAWHSVPVGSMPCDLEVFAARIGCTQEFLQAHGKILLRGWKRHADDNLYHQYITDKVLAMKEKRRSATDRMRKHRERKSDMSHGVTDTEQNVTYAKEQEQEQEQEVLPCTSQYLPDTDCVASAQKTRSKRTRKPCPFSKIRDLWCEIILPASPTAIEPDDAEGWSPARKAQISARWNGELPDLETWRLFLEALTESKFLMGKTKPTNGHRQFRLNLFWITKPEYYQRFLEGQYDD